MPLLVYKQTHSSGVYILVITTKNPIVARENALYTVPVAVLTFKVI